MWVCPAVRYYPPPSVSPPLSRTGQFPNFFSSPHQPPVQYSILGHISRLKIRAGASRRKDTPTVEGTVIYFTGRL